MAAVLLLLILIPLIYPEALPNGADGDGIDVAAAAATAATATAAA